jgi:hypothetical protein
VRVLFVDAVREEKDLGKEKYEHRPKPRAVPVSGF